MITIEVVVDTDTGEALAVGPTDTDIDLVKALLGAAQIANTLRTVPLKP